MMKRIYTASVMLALGTAAAMAAAPSAEVRKAVLAAEAKWTAATIAGDAAALEKLVTDDLSYTHSNAKTQTKEEYIDDVSKHTTVYKAFEFQDTKMRQYGTAVVVTHNAAITSVQAGESHLYLTEVWVQQGGRWMMASRQATKLP